jgi:hypothetical protein
VSSDPDELAALGREQALGHWLRDTRIPDFDGLLAIAFHAGFDSGREFEAKLARALAGLGGQQR